MEKFATLGLGVSIMVKRSIFLFNNLLLVAKQKTPQGDEEDLPLKYIKAVDIQLLSPISVPDVVGRCPTQHAPIVVG